MRFLPLSFDLTSGAVALIGAGPAALCKLQLLQAAGAKVRWYSDNSDVAKTLLRSSRPHQLEMSFADPLQANFREFIAVILSAGDDVDGAIAERARAENIPINVIDQPELSTFNFPAIIDRGEVVVSVSTGGASPVLARLAAEVGDGPALLVIGDVVARSEAWRTLNVGHAPASESTKEIAA